MNEAKKNKENVKKSENISFLFLLKLYTCIFIFLFIFMSKIYINNQIYYISRDISQLNTNFTLLFEENINLRLKLEKLRFKREVLDDVFIE